MGTRERLAELFGDTVSIRITPRSFAFRYDSVQHWLTVWRKVYGPIHKAFQALDPQAQAALAVALCELADSLNVATDGTMVVHSKYLEVLIYKND